MAKAAAKKSVRHHAVHTVVRTQIKLGLALKTVLVLCGAGAIAAAAAAFTAPTSAIYLTISPASSPISQRVLFGSPEVPFIGLRLQSGSYPVALHSITFTFLTDTDGSFTNGIQNNLDPASAISDCTLVDNNSVRVSSPVVPTPGSRTITFFSTYSLPANSTGGVQVVCDLAKTAPFGVVPDALALTVASTNDVNTISTIGSLPPEAISMSQPLNANGSNVTILLDLPLSAADENAVNGQTPGSTTPPPQVLTVTAISPSSTGYAVPGSVKIEAARFRFDGPAGTTLHALHFAACQGTGCLASLILRARLQYTDATGKTTTTSAVARGSDGTWDFNGLQINASPSATAVLLVDVGNFSAADSGLGLSFSLVPAGSSVGWGNTSANQQLVFAKSRPSLTLSTSSPSGNSARAMDEVLRFNLTATAGPVDIFGLTFHITATDGANTGWSSCQNLATSAKWGMRDASNLNVRLEDPGDWTFYKDDGTPCDGSTDPVAYATVYFPRAGDTQAKSIGTGKTITWLLRVDASGADSGDGLSVYLPTQAEANALTRPIPGFIWSDTWVTKPFDGNGVPGLPLAGNSLSF